MTGTRVHYQCSLAAAAGSRCTGARSGVVTERGSRGIGAAQKVLSPHTAVMPKELALRRLSGHQTSERNLLPLHESYQRFFEALEFPCERRQKVRIFREALPEGRNRVRGLRHCSARN